jgi:hypothetical protein
MCRPLGTQRYQQYNLFTIYLFIITILHASLQIEGQLAGRSYTNSNKIRTQMSQNNISKFCRNYIDVKQVSQITKVKETVTQK